ncbi:hypothetical protein JOQ06_004002 [Pogonophryne albipinna]|nr:hypothetical protein JOQ06_004002 [Pogonophryne albipinna]
MRCTYIVIIIPLLWVKGVSPDVFQSPAVVLTEVKLSCRHSINGFDSTLWFLRPPGETSLQLIGFTRCTKVVEKPFQGFFNMSVPHTAGITSVQPLVAPRYKPTKSPTKTLV